jgi:hypothetical protein
MAIRTGRQAGKAKSVTTVPAVALAEAGQLTHIVRVIGRYVVLNLHIVGLNNNKQQ